EKRAKLIHAEGEFAASQRLAEAAHVLATEPTTMQLRYLQTLTEIGVEKNTTIVFPLPIELMGAMIGALNGNDNPGRSAPAVAPAPTRTVDAPQVVRPTPPTQPTQPTPPRPSAEPE